METVSPKAAVRTVRTSHAETRASVMRWFIQCWPCGVREEEVHGHEGETIEAYIESEPAHWQTGSYIHDGQERLSGVRF
jgi:hypothetical protein